MGELRITQAKESTVELLDVLIIRERKHLQNETLERDHPPLMLIKQWVG